LLFINDNTTKEPNRIYKLKKRRFGKRKKRLSRDTHLIYAVKMIYRIMLIAVYFITNVTINMINAIINITNLDYLLNIIVKLIFSVVSLYDFGPIEIDF